MATSPASYCPMCAVSPCTSVIEKTVSHGTLELRLVIMCTSNPSTLVLNSDRETKANNYTIGLNRQADCG